MRVLNMRNLCQTFGCQASRNFLTTYGRSVIAKNFPLLGLRACILSLVFPLEDTARLFSTLLLLDPIHFPKSEPCLIYNILDKYVKLEHFYGQVCEVETITSTPMSLI